MNSKIKAFVAAGGNGTRLKLNRPKSSIYFKGHSLGYWTVLSLHICGVEEIEFYVNNAIWAKKFEIELKNIPGCRVIRDKGYKNTFLLFKNYATEESKYIFTYGHTPHPPTYFKRLLNHPGRIIVSTVTKTSKKQPIKVTTANFIEPPYAIQIDNKVEFSSNTWASFFYINKAIITNYIKLPISEFNYIKEWLSYKTYLKSYVFDRLFKRSREKLPIHKGKRQFI